MSGTFEQGGDWSSHLDLAPFRLPLMIVLSSTALLIARFFIKEDTDVSCSTASIRRSLWMLAGTLKPT